MTFSCSSARRAKTLSRWPVSSPTAMAAIKLCGSFCGELFMALERLWPSTIAPCHESINAFWAAVSLCSAINFKLSSSVKPECNSVANWRRISARSLGLMVGLNKLRLNSEPPWPLSEATCLIESGVRPCSFKERRIARSESPFCVPLVCLPCFVRAT